MALSRAALPMGTLLGEFSLVRALASGRAPTHAARVTREDGGTDLVVVEHLPVEQEEQISDLMRAGKRLVSLSHPNVTRVRGLEVIERDGHTEVLFVSEFVDAERYDDVVTAAAEARKPMSLAMHLRVLVDALSGLSALHLLRDAEGELRLLHGEVCPAHVLVSIDGSAKIAHVARVPRDPSDAAAGYVAPEVRLGDAVADHRSDVYSAGVMLWEALAGRRLFKDTSGILPKQLSDKLELAPIPPEEAWAAPLAEVAARALAANPQARYSSAAELAAELRKIAGARLALKSSLASLVNEVCGDRIADRRHELAGGAGSFAGRKSIIATPPRAIPAEVLARAIVPKIYDEDEDVHNDVTRQQHIPAIARKVAAPPIPPSAIVTPPSAAEAEKFDDLTTRKVAAATIPTRPFAFVPQEAKGSSKPPPLPARAQKKPEAPAKTPAPEAKVKTPEPTPAPVIAPEPPAPKPIVPEPTPEPLVVGTTSAPPASRPSGPSPRPAAGVPAPRPMNKQRIVLAVVGVAFLILVAAAIRAAFREPIDVAAPPSPFPSAVPPPPEPAPVVTNAPAIPPPASAPDPGAGGAQTPSATPAPAPRPRVTPRPKATYDPQGI